MVARGVVLGVASLASTASANYAPAWFWSEKLDLGVGRNAHHKSEAHPGEVERGLYAIQTYADGSVGPFGLKQPAGGAPEISLVFSCPGLETERVRKNADALDHLERLLKVSKSSLSVPFTSGAGPMSTLFHVAATVEGHEASAYLESHQELFKNKSPDVVVVQMPKADGELASLQTVDDLVGEIMKAVSAHSEGNYVAVLTGTQSKMAGRRQLQAADGPAPLKITRDLLTALLIGLFLFVIFMSGFCCLFSLQTPRKFEDVSKATAEH